MRLDNELVLRKIFPTRNKSQEAIRSGIVFCDGKSINKPAFDVDSNTKIEIVGEKLKYVSRAGLKLERAIEVFNINLTNKVMLDIGSSTGGFTDCALQKNVKKVIAVDVGTDVMDKSLRDNPKLELYENTDIREMDVNLLKDVNIATIDVSFISVTKVIDIFNKLPNLATVMCLIKPQFECGKAVADKYRGVVLDKQVHYSVICDVISAFKQIGFNLTGLAPSPIKGGSGNIEYLSLFKTDEMSKLINIKEVINTAFNIRPQKSRGWHFSDW